MNALQEISKVEIKTRAESLENLLNSFINNLDAKPTTANTYKKALQQFIKWLMDSGIYEIGREDLTAYKRFLMANCTANTVSSYITALKTFYKWLEAERITPNIAATLKGAKTAKGFKKDTLTPEQAKRILNNISLNDFGIPLMLSHTVVQIHGKDRVTGVTIAKVDEKRTPIKETEQYIACDTLLLSCGLLPENELTKGAGIEMDRITGGAITDQSRQTSIPGVFACGNVLHVHDLVDYVSDEAEIAGCAAADYLAAKQCERVDITLQPISGVRYTVPQKITCAQDTVVYFRVADVYRDKRVVVKCGDRVISNKKKIKLAPGEMETVKLTADVLAEIGQGTISIGLED